MNWLMKALGSSIGKKVLMAITGLGLCGFLVAHLGGNLLLYVGVEEYNHYAIGLHEQKILLAIAEVGLLLLFIVHIYLAFKTDSENKKARTVDYAVKQTKMDQSAMAAPASAVMFGTGIVVLVFLLVHLYDFRLAEWTRPEVNALPPYERAIALLQMPLSAAVYVVGSIVLGYHVLHGLQSAFQTLGLNHPKYMPCIKWLSLGFAIIVGAGFASFPIWAWVAR